MSETLINSVSISVSFFIASENGTASTLWFLIPIITSLSPAIKASIAKTPNLLAKTLSKQLGEPPRCICPKTVTLTSYSFKFTSI